MFERTVNDFIRGLRSHKYSADYVLKCQNEIQVEINQPSKRKNAIQKLLILYLIGNDITWAAFHIIQSMSVKEEKRAGYLIATLAFNQNSPILIMATNLIKKDLVSSDYKEVLLALHTLAQITSSDLSRDLHFDVCNLLSHSHAAVRKRAILVLFRMFKKYPLCWDACFSRLQSKLEDSDPGVVSCCVTVICELGKEDPKRYLSLAPQLFGLLVSSSNNWMLIKMVKLFASLTPHEPRLVKKLLETLKKLIEQSRAISVVYECVFALIRGDMILGSGREVEELRSLCFSKLEYFLNHPDQNIRFLGLYALSKLAIKMPEAVSTHHRIVLQCIEDKDLSIRTQSLQLVSGIVNGQSLYEIVKKLMVHLSHENEALDVYSAEIVEYRTFVARVIISCCTNDSYKNLGDFEWFIDVLTDLWKFHGMTVGKLVSEELINVCVRVSQVREYALTKCRELLSNVNVQKASSDGASVLAAASWITGEYTADEKIEIHLLESLLSPEILQLNSEIQLFFLYAFLKLLLRFRQQHFNLNLNIFSNLLGCFVNSSSLEVQERASFLLALVSDHSAADDSSDSIWAGTQIFTFFNEEIQPISSTAQSRVKIPDGFDLDTWIVPLRSKPELQSLSADIPLQILEVHESGTAELEKVEILELDQAPELQSIIRKPANRKYELKQDFEDGLKDSNTAPPPSKIPDLSSSKKAKTRPESRKKAHKRTSSQLKEKILTHLSGKKYRIWSHDGLNLQISWSQQAQSLIQQTKIRLETYLSLLDEKGSPIIFKIEPTETSSSIQVHEFDEKHKVLIFRLKRENTDALFSRSVSATLSLPESKITIQFQLPFDINFLLPNQPELATMTPPKFMKILQTPPLGYFSAVGTSNIVAPEAMDLDQICNSLASAINCIIVERHPEASSLYGLLCNNIPIVGLVKKRLNSKGKKVLSIEIKTGDSKVLEWVIDTLSNFAAELVP